MGNNKVNKYSGLILSLLTITTFVFALRAVPISGSFSISTPLQYPYLATENQFPNDYIWMYFAIFMLITYLVYITSIESQFKDKISVRVSFIFTMFSVLILVTTYFLQAEVIPVNILHEQYNGVSLFTQYNPLGVFIASEVLGHYFLMLSLLLITPVFEKSRGRIFLKYFIIISFIGSVIAYIIFSIAFGLEKMERVEVTIICITWIDLIVIGFVSFFNKQSN